MPSFSGCAGLRESREPGSTGDEDPRHADPQGCRLGSNPGKYRLEEKTGPSIALGSRVGSLMSFKTCDPT
jgi:hypothetical protein